MKKNDLLRESISSLRSNKLRTFLTTLGIVIGVASVVAMLSLGEGSKLSIKTSIESLGSNNLVIFPGVIQPGRGFVSSGRGTAEILDKKDVDELRKIDDIVGVSPEIQRRFQVISDRGNNQNAFVLGIDYDFFMVRNVEIDRGKMITEENVRSYYRGAILGPQIAKDLFNNVDPLGKRIRINNINFRIIGITKPKGSTGFINYDDFILVPYTVMQKQLAGTEYFNAIAVKVISQDIMEKVRQEIEKRLMELHRVQEPNFTVFSQQDILNALTSVINVFTIFLSFIAGISLIVGGIGIMNMMLTTVTERIKEIGLRKSLGAKRKDILNQFLLESIIITFLGGIIGLLLGISLSLIIGNFTDITTVITLKTILLPLCFSVMVGIVFGYYPAKKASNFSPIDALRYE
ncbi:MAG: ABC transporter permease [Patescibacteria group bacterium]|nr:ABC transporter permease [Patescibacteria group bacterium]